MVNRDRINDTLCLKQPSPAITVSLDEKKLCLPEAHIGKKLQLVHTKRPKHRK